SHNLELDDEDSIWAQQLLGCLNCFQRIYVVVNPYISKMGAVGMRIEKGKNNQVEMFAAVLHITPCIIPNRPNAGRTVRLFKVILLPQFQNQRIDLYCRDLGCAVSERSGYAISH